MLLLPDTATRTLMTEKPALHPPRPGIAGMRKIGFLLDALHHHLRSKVSASFTIARSRAAWASPRRAAATNDASILMMSGE